MALDPRIPMGVNLPQRRSLMNPLAQAMQLRGIEDQYQAQQAERAAMQQEREAQNALAQFAQGQDLTTPEGQNALLQRDPRRAGAFLEPVLKVQKAQGEQKEAGIKARKAEFDFQQSRLEKHRQALAMIQSPQQAVQWVQAGRASGLYTDEDVAQELQAIPQDPAQFAQWKQGQALAGVELAKQLQDLRQREELAYRKTNDEANRKVTIRGQDVSAATARRGQDMTDARARDALTAKTDAPPKPLPPGALKMQQEALDAIGVVGSVTADLAALEGQIDAGKLSFGPVSNLKNAALNMAGMSSEQSRNFATFKSNLERLRNESLRLNAGVQTEGDAQRAWNELFQNINDTALVKQRLGEIQALNRRAADLQKLKVDSIRANYGMEPMDTSAYAQQPASVGGGPKPGTVENGYRFKGGNPGDPNSWEKVK